VASGRVRGARYQKRKNGVAASQSWALGLGRTPKIAASLRLTHVVRLWSIQHQSY
jgi:hypothetical protein